jgi:hypothetical protein
MAAITLITGSILGWVAAAVALVGGALASTAVLVFLLTCFGFSAITLFAAALRQANPC